MRCVLVILIVAGLGCQESRDTASRGEPSTAGESMKSYNTISRQQLSEMFQNIERKSSWDTSKLLLWGYFFVSESKTQLERLRPRLEESGYRFVEYLEPDDADDRLFLHVEKEESHTVDSLHSRNEQLARLGHEFGVTYDGMDVGAITPK